MGDLVSNNKREATYRGRKRAFLVGDRVRFTQMPAFDGLPGEVVEIRDSLFPYLVRLDNGYYVGADWLALEPDPFETTGEHVFHKLSDDLYQDWADDAPQHRKPKVDHWTPTVGELGLSLGIMAFIVLIFVFLVFFYRGW